MSFQRFAFDTCPRCYEPIELATIEPSPARRDLVLHNFRCADCGSVKTKVLSLKPGEPLPEPAAYRSRRSDRVRPLFAKGDTPTIILLVEDSPGDIRLTLEAFGEANQSVRLYVAEDGAEAMAFLRREGDNADAPRPELILLDLNMPKMDGREVLALIESDESLKLIPTVILTTSAAEADFVECYQRQANCYLTKPVELDVFENLVKGLNDFWATNARLPQLAFVA
jgi:two-component system, chemotaxis family, response regulator Rcp1